MTWLVDELDGFFRFYSFIRCQYLHYSFKTEPTGARSYNLKVALKKLVALKQICINALVSP